MSAPDQWVYSGAAPNLTNLMTRNTFAGASWDLLTEECRDDVWNASPEEFGDAYLAGVTEECLNEVDLREWLRDAPAKKPMYADPEKLDRDRRQVPRHAEPRAVRRPDQRTGRLPVGAEVMERTDGAHRTSYPSTRARRRRPAVTRRSSYGVFRRPVHTTGWSSWVFTIDHKKLGIMYGVTALFFFLLGGVEALLIRAQLAGNNGTILSADKYNQMFTMHATTMIFLFVMPMVAGFANYFCRSRSVPVTSPSRASTPSASGRFLFAGIFLNTSWFLGGARRRWVVHVRPQLVGAVLAVERRRLLGARPADRRHRLADRRAST